MGATRGISSISIVEARAGISIGDARIRWRSNQKRLPLMLILLQLTRVLMQTPLMRMLLQLRWVLLPLLFMDFSLLPLPMRMLLPRRVRESKIW